MLGEYTLRYVYAFMVAGALGVLSTRLVANWLDWDAWVVRVISYFLLLIGIVGIAALQNPGTALIALGIAAVVCPAMVVLDNVLERREAELATERRQRLLRERGGSLRRIRREAEKEHETLAVHFPAEITRFYGDRKCAACGKSFRPAGPFVECPGCREWLHTECWDEAGGCVTEGCPNKSQTAAADARTVPAAAGGRHVGMCPTCLKLIGWKDEHVVCADCETPYHDGCWPAEGACAVCGGSYPG